jgi:hypothetical protein
MTIHFAAARPAISRIVAGHGAGNLLAKAANDNGEEALNATLLRAALKHFARYGIGAAQQASKEAERAFFAGDRDGYDWWLAICRTLDRRTAGTLTNSISRAP